jgi:hypothetical protein
LEIICWEGQNLQRIEVVAPKEEEEEVLCIICALNVGQMKTIILTVSLERKYIFYVRRITAKNHSLFYCRVQTGEIICLERVSCANVKLGPNCTARSISLRNILIDVILPVWLVYKCVKQGILCVQLLLYTSHNNTFLMHIVENCAF